MKGQKNAVRFALYSAAWYLAGVPRVLVPCSPAQDEEAEDAWVAEGRALLAHAPYEIEHQDAALRLLGDQGRAGEAARKAAREAIVAAHGDLVIGSVRAFGPGWRERPAVALS